MLPRPSFPDAPGPPSVALSTCPYHLTFLSWSAPAYTLVVVEVGEYSVLFLLSRVH